MFGKILRKRRLELGLTLEKLAKKLKTYKGYISGVENGAVSPFSMKMIPRTALVLGVDVEACSIMAWADKAPKLVRGEVKLIVLDWLKRNHPDIYKVVL
jgi:transcriptional regulator with XRE-family HTH domain